MEQEFKAKQLFGAVHQRWCSGADDASQIRPAMAVNSEERRFNSMNENKYFNMLPELYEIVTRLPQAEQEKLANIGMGILLARGAGDGK